MDRQREGRVWVLLQLLLDWYSGDFAFETVDCKNHKHVFCMCNALLVLQAQHPSSPGQAFEGNRWWKSGQTPQWSQAQGAAFCKCVSAGDRRRLERQSLCQECYSCKILLCFIFFIEFNLISFHFINGSGGEDCPKTQRKGKTNIFCLSFVVRLQI